MMEQIKRAEAINGNVSTANTMIDCLQLFFYVSFRLKIACKLDRFDLPFICGGVIAIVY